MAEETIVVRRVDMLVYKKFRERAVRRGVRVGEALTKLMEKEIEDSDEGKVSPKNFIKMIGIVKTGKKVNYSEQVDDILYG